MKFFKKIVVFVLVSFIAIGVLGNTGINAGMMTEPEAIVDFTPEFEVEAVLDNTAIKITIPKQAYLEFDAFNTIYYPAAYQVTLDVESNGKTISSSFYAESLYKSYYPAMPAGGYGPYKIDEDTTLGQPHLINGDGTEERTYIFFDLEPGEYSVKLQAYDIGDYLVNEKEDIYRSGYKYWSQIATKEIRLKENDAKEIVTGYKTKYDFSKVKKGDIIKFGSYEQDTNLLNGREPIEWVVLEKTKKQMLVVSKYVLDKLPYNATEDSVTWDNCTLRMWLNDSFYNFAFNKSEQKLINTTKLKNSANSLTGVSGGKDTKDKVFILSYQDVVNSSYGFSKKALTHDAKRRSAFAFDENRCGRWWLRTPAYDQNHALFVGSEGGLEYKYGASVNSLHTRATGLGVRPAMYIKLS